MEKKAGLDFARVWCHCGWALGWGWETEGLFGWPVTMALIANKVQLLLSTYYVPQTVKPVISCCWSHHLFGINSAFQVFISDLRRASP